MITLTVIPLRDAHYINTIFKQTSTPKPSSQGIFGKSLNPTVATNSNDGATNIYVDSTTLNPSVATNANDGATKIYVDPATPSKTLSVRSASTFG